MITIFIIGSLLAVLSWVGAMALNGVLNLFGISLYDALQQMASLFQPMADLLRPFLSAIIEWFRNLPF